MVVGRTKIESLRRETIGDVEPTLSRIKQPDIDGEPRLPHLEIHEGKMTRMRVRKVHKGPEVKSSNSHHPRFI